MHPTIAIMVKEELQKKLKAKFIQPIDYSKWILNMVLIKKPNVKICICTNFQDLNKAYPKDDFTLSNIHSLIDPTTKHDILSLMDGFSRYNKIRIGMEDNIELHSPLHGEHFVIG